MELTGRKAGNGRMTGDGQWLGKADKVFGIRLFAVGVRVEFVQVGVVGWDGSVFLKEAVDPVQL